MRQKFIYVKDLRVGQRVSMSPGGFVYTVKEIERNPTSADPFRIHYESCKPTKHWLPAHAKVYPE